THVLGAEEGRAAKYYPFAIRRPVWEGLAATSSHKLFGLATHGRHSIDLPLLARHSGHEHNRFFVRRPAGGIDLHRRESQLLWSTAVHITSPECAFRVGDIRNHLSIQGEVQAHDGFSLLIWNPLLRPCLVAHDLATGVIADSVDFPSILARNW